MKKGNTTKHHHGVEGHKSGKRVIISIYQKQLGRIPIGLFIPHSSSLIGLLKSEEKTLSTSFSSIHKHDTSLRKACGFDTEEQGTRVA